MEAQQQKRKWRDSSNTKRKAQYREDSSYREKVREQSRETGRKAHGGLQADRAHIIRDSLSSLPTHSVMRKLINSDLEIPTFTTAELTPLMGISNVVIVHGWQRTGRFPRPRLEAIVGRTHAHVYTLQEAEKLLSVMAMHFSSKNYLNQSDEETVALLNKAML